MELSQKWLEYIEKTDMLSESHDHCAGAARYYTFITWTHRDSYVRLLVSVRLQTDLRRHTLPGGPILLRSHRQQAKRAVRDQVILSQND